MTNKQEFKETAANISNELIRLQAKMIFAACKMENLAHDAHHQALLDHSQELRNASETIDSWIAGIEEDYL